MTATEASRSLSDLLDAIEADELGVAAVTIAEYRIGIELADTAQRAADRA